MSCKKKSSVAAAREAAAANVPLSTKEQRAQALETAATYLTAAQAKAAPLTAQASEKLAPLAKATTERLAPLGDQAKEYGSKALTEAQKNLRPALENARDIAKDVTQNKVVPALQQAYDTFQKDVLPEIEDRAQQVAQHPLTQEAGRRGQAAVAALRGQAVEVAPSQAVAVKKRGGFKKFLGFTAVVGIIGAGVVAARKFLGKADDGWTAHEPTETYSWTPKAPTQDARSDADQEAAAEPVAESAPAEAPVVEDTPVTEPAAASPETVAETPAQSPVEEAGQEKAPEAEPAAADGAMIDGEGTEGRTTEGGATASYVGDNPPEGFVIKGNERSKKYHVPGSGGYDRTIADVWFSSEADAEAAGFTRAQR
ncbi:sunset domain-containing protein [Acidipropionibacterium timonense]|uniref:sunset domain-containing protein n=1 Tax=Acidipropionibacterium timonense TaxID=2161818 RepID=UPI00102F4F1C|nr:DUF5324 family protein [Acidipropionibacterium timonense]